MKGLAKAAGVGVKDGFGMAKTSKYGQHIGQLAEEGGSQGSVGNATMPTNGFSVRGPLAQVLH